MKIKGMFIYIFLGFLTLSYQNCAAPQSDLDPNLLSQQEETPPIQDADVIDQIKVGAIFFPEKTMHISSVSDSLDVLGVCEQTGSIISWTLRTPEGLLIDRGRSECEQGAFSVELGTNWKSECGDMQLKAALGAKASSEVTLISDCVFEN